MNKKLTIHLIVLFVYIAAVLFVLGGNEPTMSNRVVIVGGFLLSQFIAAVIPPETD